MFSLLLENIVETNAVLVPPQFNATGSRLRYTACGRGHPNIGRSLQGGSWLNGCFEIWSDWLCNGVFLWYGWSSFTETHFTTLKSIRIPSCTRGRFRIWNSRSGGASRHQSMREFPHKQRPNLLQVGSIRKHTEMDGYTVKPVCNDHLYDEIYCLWFI